MIHTTYTLISTCDSISEAIKAGVKPKLTEDGTSGTYLMRGLEQLKTLAVFKPIDEECFAPNNPRQFRGNFGDATFRQGVKSGESTLREYAAYLIDSKGFSAVPTTIVAEIDAQYFPSN